jgi:hypothetical protein
MAVIVGVVCACVFCWVALSVLSWHAKVEEELVVCEILSTTTNLFMGLSYERCFFFDDMQNEKNLRALLITTNLFMGLSYEQCFFLMTCKMKKIEFPFDYNKFMGLSYKRCFFFKVVQNAKHLRALLTITNLWDWVINDVFFWRHAKCKTFESPFDYNTFMGWVINNFFFMTCKTKIKLRAHFNSLYI